MLLECVRNIVANKVVKYFDYLVIKLLASFQVEYLRVRMEAKLARTIPLIFVFHIVVLHLNGYSSTIFLSFKFWSSKNLMFINLVNKYVGVEMSRTTP